MSSSLQRDVAAGRPNELDGIGGPIHRGGRRHGIPVPNTEQLARLVATRTEQN
jgi:2-dehydropantoate 2-reductase